MHINHEKSSQSIIGWFFQKKLYLLEVHRAHVLLCALQAHAAELEAFVSLGFFGRLVQSGAQTSFVIQLAITWNTPRSIHEILHDGGPPCGPLLEIKHQSLADLSLICCFRRILP